MRVLLAAHQELALGGIGAVARGYAAHLPAAMAGHGTVTVARGGRREAPIGLLGARGAAARGWHEQVTLAREARPFDLIHLCDLRPILFSRTPFVLTVHDLDFLDHPDRYPRGARSYKSLMFEAAVRRGPAAIVCLSEYVRKSLERHLPERAAASVRVIAPGVEPGSAEWSGAAIPDSC